MAAVRRTPLMVAIWRLHRTAFRLSGGRLGARINGMPVLLLTTRGRKSGRPKSVALQYVPEGAGYAVIASYAGEDRDPAWWRNLKVHPEAEVLIGGKTERIRAREIEGPERERLWRKAAALYPGYDEYPKWTARRIPVVLLEPIA